ncbi:MAG: DUF1707 and DUF2154 domain-containing protein [Nocardioidaceae bacterium]|nr:DUF1707 and DUF2154 domain-containing protein [Nocardioidaceae bacterium]NUS53019.1 DUF1707 and DUF2154 domain-containing protein [Nocardioidaceae bacterium]
MEGQAPDPARLRISDDDRHKVAEVLRQAAGEGRIDLDELDQRLEATYQAKTYGELVPITADLPTAAAAKNVAPRPQPTMPVGAAPSHASSISVMSDTKRLGQWQVGSAHAAFSLMGSVTLDLREAAFETREVVINANAIMGEVTVIVNAHTAVVIDGFGVMGEYSEQRSKVPAQVTADSPVVRLRGMALMGAVHVQRKGPPGRSSRRQVGWR